MTNVKLEGAVGDEIALTYNDKTLIVKLSDDGIVPDFVSAFMKAFAYASYEIADGCVGKYHMYRNAEERLEYALGYARDKLFDSIKPPVEEEKPAEETESDGEQQDSGEQSDAESEPDSATRKTTRKTTKKTTDAQ